MMVMVEGMAKAGFFRWLCLTIAKAVKYKVMPIPVSYTHLDVYKETGLGFPGSS